MKASSAETRVDDPAEPDGGSESDLVLAGAPDAPDRGFEEEEEEGVDIIESRGGGDESLE